MGRGPGLAPAPLPAGRSLSHPTQLNAMSTPGNPDPYCRRAIVSKKRLLGAVGFSMAIIASSFAVSGATSARFSATRSSGSSTLSAGTVTGTGSSLQACSSAGVFPSGIFPGNSSTVTELNPAGSTQTITTGSNAGVPVQPLAQAIASGQTLLIGQGTSSPTPVTVTATAGGAALGATSITFTYSGTSVSFPAGSLVTDLSTQNLAPAQVPCKFSYSYGGSIPEYVAVDVLIVSGDATHPELWDSSTAGLQLMMTDQANNVYTLPTTTTGCGSVPSPFTVPAGTLACGLARYDVLSTTTVSSGSFTLTLNWGLPVTAPNADQNGNTTVYVLFHAVQSRNNTIHCGVTPTVAGQPCVPSGTFGWT